MYKLIYYLLFCLKVIVVKSVSVQHDLVANQRTDYSNSTSQISFSHYVNETHRPELKSDACSLTLDGPSDSFTWPQSCPDSLSCDIRIAPIRPPEFSSSIRLVLVLTYHDMNAMNCIHMFDTNNSSSSVENSTPKSSFCGKLINPVGLTSTFPQMVIALRRRQVGVFEAGFNVRYTTDPACYSSRVLPSTNGTFTSPFYPEAYSAPITCQWNVPTQPANKMLLLRFDAFNVGWASNTACETSYTGYFRIYWTSTTYTSYCNSNLPPTTMYIKNPQSFRFYAGSASYFTVVDGQGFSAYFEVVDEMPVILSTNLPNEMYDSKEVHTKSIDTLHNLNRSVLEMQRASSECGEGKTVLLSDYSGQIVSPNFPNNHTLNSNCSWNILAAPTSVTIAFSNLSLSWADCVHVTCLGSRYIDDQINFCGTTIASRQFYCQYTSSTTVQVRFRITGVASSPGFRMLYTHDPAGSLSSSRLLTTKGTIVSPFWPLTYTQALSFNWYFLISWTKVVVLRFDVFNIGGPNDGSCIRYTYDMVEIRSFNLGTQRYCGKNAPPVLNLKAAGTGSDGFIYIYFYSATNSIPVAGSEFVASYEIVDDPNLDCGDARLAGSALPYEGRLEYFLSNQWGPVCRNNFNDVDAAVACNQLGYGYAGRVIDNVYGPSSGNAVMNNVQCNGTEACLTRCQFTGASGCTQSDVVAISCRVTMCSLTGAGHYRTFDMLRYDYSGSCKYMFVRPIQDETGLPYFEVLVKTEHRYDITDVAWPLYVEIVYNNDVVRMIISDSISSFVPVDVLVNGIKVSIPYVARNSSSTHYTVSYLGRYMLFSTPFGLNVEFDGFYTILVYVPPQYDSKLTGMCGDNDNNVTNDFTASNGTYVGDSPDAANEVGDSYIIDDPEFPDQILCRGSPPPKPCIPVPPEYVSRCGQITNTAGVFGTCIRKIGSTAATEYYTDCVTDACVSDGRTICNSVERFADMCNGIGVEFNCGSWQAATGCDTVDRTCPVGLNYSCNATACPATCSDPDAPSKCDEPNREGCVCPDGQVLDDGICVDSCQVGCLDDKQQFKPIGEVWPGDQCTTLTCLPCSNCTFGGRIESAPGCPGNLTCTSGTTCTIDDCISSPCQNNGTCIDSLNSYTCNCAVGFTGVNCIINIDECSSSPCPAGATCLDGNNGYTCLCPAGLTGFNCATDIDDCWSSPCFNEGTCVDGLNSYTCMCAIGYTGERCQTYVDVCTSSPCLNDATCVDGIGSFTCSCVSGYTGVVCETDFDECSSVPCRNGGTCTEGINIYTCTCGVGFTGISCETNIDECTSSPCNNGATCVDGIDSFTCNCVDGFTGVVCETDIDECASSPCRNGATCVEDLNSFTCNCVDGYTGVTCETDINNCESLPCRNGGMCIDGINMYSCTCAFGFTGINCETEIDECASMPCLNEATCVDEINGFRCDCGIDFTGITCESTIDNCADEPCENGGTCTDGVGYFTCFCILGFTGQLCETEFELPPPAPESACSADSQPLDFEAYFGEFSTLSYPSNYGNNADCQWRITALEETGIVELRFNAFSTEECCDFVTLHNGDSGKSPLIQQLSGVLPASVGTFTTTQRHMFIRFRSDEEDTDTGFKATFFTTNSGNPCAPETRPLQLRGYGGKLSSSNYPGDYDNDADCQWLIRVPVVNAIVNVVFIDINTESCCDVITIFDGDNFESNLIATLSGTGGISPAGYNSTQRYMLIRFTTDSEFTAKGFTAEFLAITAITTD